MNASQQLKEGYINKLKGKYFGLLCEREKNREWENFLDSILIELYGFSEEDRTINWIELVNKTNTLRFLNYDYFRKTIFECMNLICGLEQTRNLEDE